MSTPLQITIWPSRTATTGAHFELDGWPELVKFVSSPVVAEDKNALEGWSPVKFTGNRRGRVYVEAVSAIVLDDDSSGLPVDHIAVIWSGVAGLVHTSYSSTPEAPRYRVILRVSRDMTSDEHARVWRYVRDHAVANGETIDEATKDPSRLWYVPAHREGAPFECRELTGEPIDVDAVLAAVPAETAPNPSGTTTPAERAVTATSEAATTRREAAAALLASAWPPIGKRHDAKKSLAGALARDGWSEDEAVRFFRAVYSGLASPNGGDVDACVRSTFSRAASHRTTGWATLGTIVDAAIVSAARGLLSDDGFHARIAQLDAAREASDTSTSPANDTAAPISFPVDALPPVLARFVSALAVFVKVPIDMPAMFALGACAAAVAGKVDLEVTSADYIEPLNLFVLVGAKTGERKSPAHAACFAPLEAVEQIKAEGMRPHIAQVKAQRDMKAKLLSKRQTERANLRREDVQLERQNHACAPGGIAIDREIDELAAEIESIVVPPVPRLFVEDITVERLAALMGEHAGRMCVTSDEGTILQNIAGRYAKDGRASFDVLLKGYSGTTLRVDRQSTDRPPVYVPRPRLTIVVAVQPEVIEGLAKDRTMRSQGLLARFLYALPDSMVGKRPATADALPADVRDGYSRRLRELASLPTPEEMERADIPHIRLSPAARDLFLKLQTDVERRLDPKTGDLADIIDWASKYPGQVARIAGILHVVEHGPRGEVSPETMNAAARIGEYLLAHARAAFGSMGKSEVETDAEAIVTWARRRPGPFTLRDFVRLGPGSLRGDKKRRTAALELLAERGTLRTGEDGWAVAA